MFLTPDWIVDIYTLADDTHVIHVSLIYIKEFI